ncbi:MAG: AMP-dependent synthetase and ligase [Polyangiaceae bacterium]|jgi:acyl-CoA synthetase (AMP-forming)/AMP-acid ligase II|nr:AMP-dependent synthetase and ligase [Polyangiaceae bacterium]
MNADWFFDRLLEWGDRQALVASGKPTTYAALLAASREWRGRFADSGLAAGDVVAIEGSFSLQTCGAFLAAMGLGAIVVPLTPLMRAHRDNFLSIAEVSLLVEVDESDAFALTPRDARVTNPLTQKLRQRQHPGLVIFSSGSTGAPKAILHDLSAILGKFRTVRQQKTTLTFLLFDHIGGIDTMLNTFGSGGCVVTVAERTPELVARAIEEHRVHTLPTSPTFLNLFLISGVWQERDLSSLKVIAYGTEPMPQSTLDRLHEAFPDVALVQTYGMSELGVLRSRSRDSTSLWIKFTGEEFNVKIVDGILWVKADSAMLGYLNAPDLFDAEGWLNTQDAVETDGEYLRILGRKSDLINVGGQKVYPAEVENALLQLDNVADVAVFGKAHPMMGQIVAARFNLKEPEPLDLFKRRMNAFCRERLAKFQTPLWVELVEASQFGARFKKLRQ